MYVYSEVKLLAGSGYS